MGKYRGAAHTICNLKYSIPKEITLIFYKESNYDYDFIMIRAGIRFMDSGIMLAKTEAKGIIKVTRSLKNRGIILKGTTRKNNSQEGGLLNFLALSTRVALLSIENVLTPLAKTVLVPLGLTAAASPTNTATQKKVFGSRTTLIISNEEMDDIAEKRR